MCCKIHLQRSLGAKYTSVLGKQLCHASFCAVYLGQTVIGIPSFTEVLQKNHHEIWKQIFLVRYKQILYIRKEPAKS